MVPTPVLVVIGGAIGAAVASSGGRSATGFVIGLALGAGIGALGRGGAAPPRPLGQTVQVSPPCRSVSRSPAPRRSVAWAIWACTASP